MAVWVQGVGAGESAPAGGGVQWAVAAAGAAAGVAFGAALRVCWVCLCGGDRGGVPLAAFLGTVTAGWSMRGSIQAHALKVYCGRQGGCWRAPVLGPKCGTLLAAAPAGQVWQLWRALLALTCTSVPGEQSGGQSGQAAQISMGPQPAGWMAAGPRGGRGMQAMHGFVPRFHPPIDCG